MNINKERLEEVLRVKDNLDVPSNIMRPEGIEQTIMPKERIDMTEWFNHIRQELRIKDLFGNVVIK